MGSVLNNPTAFFNNMSRDEFKNFLDEFGFEYEDIDNESDTVKEIKKYIQNIKIDKLLNEKLNFTRNLETIMECEEESSLQYSFVEYDNFDFTASDIEKHFQADKYKYEASIDFDDTNTLLEAA